MRWQHWLYTIPLRLRSLFRRQQVEQDLDDELQFHLDALIAEHQRAGMTPTAARAAALRAMDGLELRKDQCRDTRRVQAIDHLMQDLRYALRGIRRSPAFSAMAVLTLALGIGATTGILSVVNAVLLRALPFPDPDRLVVIFATTPARGVTRDTTSFPDFLDWKAQHRSFTGIAAWRFDPFNVTGDGPPEHVDGLRATNELFSVLETSPLLGRAFTADEQREQRPVALISYAMWMRRFGGDARVIGRTIHLNEAPHEIVGVLPHGFQLPAFHDVDLMTPMPQRASRTAGYLRGIARLKPGVTPAAAQQDLDTISARLAQAYPESNRGRGLNLVSLYEVGVGSMRTPLLMLMGAALFVLLIGCANVGNLVLAKGLARHRELAVRSALGAGTGRLVRQLLTESLSLAIISAVLGTMFGFWGSTLLIASIAPQGVVPPPVTFDWTLLACAIGLALVSGVLCGLPPALLVRRVDVHDALKQGCRGDVGRGDGGGGGFAPRRLGSALVVAETALTIVLLMGAGLMLKSFVVLQRVEMGFEPRHLLVADLLLSTRYIDLTRREVYLDDLLRSIGSLPGVARVAVLTNPPLRGGSGQTFNVEGHADVDARTGHRAEFNVISAGYFATINTPIHRGREFDDGDGPNGMPVAVINEAMVRRFWPGGDPIGKRIRLYYDNDPKHWLTIVGVSADVQQESREIETVPEVFVPYRQRPQRTLRSQPEPYVSLAVRTNGDPAALAASVQARIWAVDKDQPVMNLQPMERVVSASVANRRVLLWLLGIFAGTALVMATAGIYGVSAYAVVRRTPEMGIRMALGATRRQILGMVLRHGMRLTLIGVALGIAGSLVLRRVIAGFLYGITPTDTSTFVAMALLFGGVALLATYIPARRAASIDPAIAFRFE